MSVSKPMSFLSSVLVVDDSDLQRSAAVELCRALGASVIHEANDGAEALAVLANLNSPPALALVDLEMPVMNGIEFFEQMHEQHYRFPIIIVSGQSSTLVDAAKSLLDLMGVPCLGALPKPINAQTLRQLLQG